MIEIVPATEDHAFQMAPRMRQQDKDEVRASGGYSPLEALLVSLRYCKPDECWTALENDEPIAMWGVTAHHGDPELGIVWLLGTDRLFEIKKTFWVHSRLFVRRMHRLFPRLANYVDERNTLSRGWLEALGFKAMYRNPAYGTAAVPFILYASTNA